MRNSAEDKIKLIFVRHGLTPANEGRKYCGRRNDEDLSEAGIKLVTARKESGIYPDADIVFVSPKKRAKHTSEIIYPGVEKIIMPEFDEMDFGDFEGKTHEELKDTPEYKAWIESDGNLPFPGGESREDYSIRVGRGFECMLQKLSEYKECGRVFSNVAITAHGGTIMAVLSKYANESYFGSMVANAGGFVCEVNPEDAYSLKVTERFPDR
ncbi:MAG: histidine phosphatase family protein [Lachnospiraceae bacterium]|nr:histidine phosphatase family protein [Lachnospiraceae bacterium]